MTKLGGVVGLGLLGAALWFGTPVQLIDVAAQPPPVPAAPDSRFAGLQWTFVRIKYNARTMPAGRGFSTFDEPWYIDAPAAEWNLSRRVRTATNIQVNDPIDLTLENPDLFNYPWIYIVEPGNLRLKDAEVKILREYLLRGGTLTFDDFHGPIEWANTEREMKRVFPERKIRTSMPGAASLPYASASLAANVSRDVSLVPLRSRAACTIASRAE